MSNPIAKLRNKARDESQNLVELSEALGLIQPRRKRAAVSPDRQRTLDIRARVQDGTPTRGSARAEGLVAKRHSKRRRALAAAVATGEPMLHKKGKQRNATKTNGDNGESGKVLREAKRSKRKVRWLPKPSVSYWEREVLSGMRGIMEEMR